MKIFNKTWFMLLMCIAFPPLGIYLIWKNKLFTKKPRVIITVISVLLLGFYLIPTGEESMKDVNDSLETEIDQEQSVENDTDETVTEVDNEQEVEADNSTEAIEEKTEIIKTDEAITTSNLEEMMKKIYPNEQIILKEFEDDDFAVLQMTEVPLFAPNKTTLRKITIAFLKGVNTKYENLAKDKYYINIEVPGTDEYGNDTFIHAATFTISKESIRKLNYENIQDNYQFDLLDTVCETVFFNPGVEE